MAKSIDCLFVGHNDMRFADYEGMVRAMGTNSGAYRDLNLSFLNINDQPYSVPDLVNLLDTDKELFHLGNVFSPAIAYLSTFLHRRGFTFDYVNSFQYEKERLAEFLTQNEILTIVIPTTLYISAFPIMEIISFIKTYNKSAKIVLGGPFIATQFKVLHGAELEYVFNMLGADYFINSSQGEAALAKLIGALKNKQSLAEIPNLTWRDGERYIINSIETENNELETNMVDWSLFKENLGNCASVRTAISCPFRCSFCGFPQHAGKYQTASIQAIEYELDVLHANGVKYLNFLDDTFNIPAERFKELLRVMIKNKYGFKWNSHYRCQFADRESIELMKESGCEGVFLGIESGSPRILGNMNKAATVEKYKIGIELLNEYEIISYGSFIIGFPGETEESIQETVDFIEENRPTFYRAQPWYCDQLTPIWQERDKYGIKGSQFEWSHNTMDIDTVFRKITDIFLNVKNSIWIPQYNFEFSGIFCLMQRGMSLEEIKQFLLLFNEGTKEKLTNPLQTNISSRLIADMSNIFGKDLGQDAEQPEEKLEADFDF